MKKTRTILIVSILLIVLQILSITGNHLEVNPDSFVKSVAQGLGSSIFCIGSLFLVIIAYRQILRSETSENIISNNIETPSKKTETKDSDTKGLRIVGIVLMILGVILFVVGSIAIALNVITDMRTVLAISIVVIFGGALMFGLSISLNNAESSQINKANSNINSSEDE